MRVLIVEDDIGIVAGLRATLSRLGWAVESTASIAAAWSALCSEPFDVILLDLGLDDGVGRSFCGGCVLLGRDICRTR